MISVPFSARQSTSVRSLGNESGAIPLALPASGGARDRLRTVAGITRAAKLAPPGTTTAVLGPLFRVLARAGLYQRFVDHQHLIHTFVTNLKGPSSALSLGGFPIAGIVPITPATGNVTVSFAVLSYAGTLTITIVSDPTACPDVDTLRRALVSELSQLVIAVDQ